ncbi:hypothetical protein THAOC_30186, partial [Thalassiosira oceanica]
RRVGRHVGHVLGHVVAPDAEVREDLREDARSLARLRPGVRDAYGGPHRDDHERRDGRAEHSFRSAASRRGNGVRAAAELELEALGRRSAGTRRSETRGRSTADAGRVCRILRSSWMASFPLKKLIGEGSVEKMPLDKSRGPRAERDAMRSEEA